MQNEYILANLNELNQVISLGLHIIFLLTVYDMPRLELNSAKLCWWQGVYEHLKEGVAVKVIT